MSKRTTGKTGHGGARPGAGATRLRYRLTKDAALKLRLIAWQRYGRPTTDDEENAVLSALVTEAQIAALAPQKEETR